MRGGRSFALLLAGLAWAGLAAAESAKVAAVVSLEDAVPQRPSLAERLAVIRERIQNALEYPPLARLRERAGAATVRFEIDSAGQANAVRVVRSSGSPQLDDAAVRAVSTAGPLPWVYGALEVPVTFELRAR